LSAGDDSAMNEKKYFGLEQEAEISALKKENSLLRNELSDVLLKYRKLEETRSALELGILGALYDPGQKSLSEREMQMLKDMLFIRKHVEALRDKISSLASEVDKRILNLDSLTEVDRAKLRCALDELNEESDNLRRIFRPVEEKNNFDKCSVLKIEGETGTIILSAGTSDGAFCGLMLYAEKTNAKIKITAVRPFVSAAILIDGEINEITPGMVFVAGKNTKK
jgi:transcription termination factor NusB